MARWAPQFSHTAQYLMPRDDFPHTQMISGFPAQCPQTASGAVLPVPFSGQVGRILPWRVTAAAKISGMLSAISIS
jgi:hypothetical protein